MKKKKKKRSKKTFESPKHTTAWFGFSKDVRLLDFKEREEFLVCKCQQLDEKLQKVLEDEVNQAIKESYEEIPIEERENYTLTPCLGNRRMGEWLVFSDEGIYSSFKNVEDAKKFAQEEFGAVVWSFKEFL